MMVKLFSVCVFTSLSLGLLSGCGSQQEVQSELDIRGGEDVAADAVGAVRQSTVALTTDYSPAGVDQPSPLEQGSSFCTGTIVSPRLIVTAAHCIQALEGRTTKGDLILPEASDYVVSFSTKVSAEADSIRAAKVIPHPDWDPSLTLSPIALRPANDIGVVVLSEDIPSYMTPVEIADVSFNVDNLPAILAGYGVTRDRNTNDTGTLRTITTEFTGENNNAQRVQHGKFLRGICAGDSGGPAYVEVDGELQLVGAASTGIEIPLLGCVGSGSNITDVRFYKDWIMSFDVN